MVFGWGLNINGQLGDGTQTSRSTPITIDELKGQPITHLYASKSNSAARVGHDRLFIWGRANDVS